MEEEKRKLDFFDLLYALKPSLFDKSKRVTQLKEFADLKLNESVLELLRVLTAEEHEHEKEKNDEKIDYLDNPRGSMSISCSETSPLPPSPPAWQPAEEALFGVHHARQRSRTTLILSLQDDDNNSVDDNNETLSSDNNNTVIRIHAPSQHSSHQDSKRGSVPPPPPLTDTEPTTPPPFPSEEEQRQQQRKPQMHSGCAEKGCGCKVIDSYKSRPSLCKKCWHKADAHCINKG